MTFQRGTFFLYFTELLSKKLQSMTQSSREHLLVKSGLHPPIHMFLHRDTDVATDEERMAIEREYECCGCRYLAQIALI